MGTIETVLDIIPKEKIKKIELLSQLREIKPGEVINIATITYFAKTIKPNLKDYQTIYLSRGKKISGNMMRLKQTGKNPWKDGTHGMPDHLAKIFQSVDESEVNKEILNYAYRLVDITLEDIFDNGKKAEREKYLAALEKENFLYVMLQIAVRLVGLNLKEKGITLENSTLDYMLDLITEDKKNIKNIFRECVKRGEPEVAIQEYYKILSKYLDKFTERQILVTGNQITKIGKETALLEDVGEETIFVFLGYLLEYLKEKYQKQKQLFENKLITIR